MKQPTLGWSKDVTTEAQSASASFNVLVRVLQARFWYCDVLADCLDPVRKELARDVLLEALSDYELVEGRKWQQ
jgi:hypothetical protein